MSAAIRGFMSMGVQGVMEALAPAFERASGNPLALTFNTTKMLLQQLRGGAQADVVVSSRDGMDGLIADGTIVPGSDVILAHSVVGIAVRKGARKPDIATPDALKRTVLAARAIGYSDPAGGGASGVHFEKLLKQLDLYEAMKPRIKYPPVGTFTAELLLTGEVELAVQQIAELNFVPGIELVGPLPGELQLVTTFVGGIHHNAGDPSHAKALLAFLRTPEAAAAFRAQGLEPV